MKTMKKTLIALAAGTGLVMACVPRTFETELRDILQKEYSMTPEEAEVGVVGGLRPKYGTRIEKDGKVQWKPNYDSVTIEKRVQQHKQMANDMDQILSFSNKENTKFIDEFQIREQLEKDEKAILFNLDKLQLVSLYKQFGQSMGLEEEEEINEASLLYPLAPLQEKLKFEAKYVEQARKINQLEVVDDLILGYKFVQEVPNPAYPEVDNTRRTIWENKQVVFRIVSHDVDFPRDYKADYIEVYRVGEKKPAIKIFHSASSSALDVAVIDYDKAGERGYGVPDEVANVMSINNAFELYSNGKDLLTKIFQEKKKLERVRPKEKEMDIAIVRVGDFKVDLCEYDKANGFSVPFEYIAKDGKNYSLAYKLKPLKDKDDKEKDDKEVLWVAKRYLTPGTGSDIVGRVVEYYRMKPDYRSNVLEINVNGQRMTISRTGLVDASGSDALFLEKEPYRITYDWGTSRWSVEDKDNKPPKYEVRYEQAKPMVHELDSLENQ